jgi:hypothetical protein
MILMGTQPPAGMAQDKILMQLIKKFVSEIRSDASPAWQVTVWFGKEIGSVEYLIAGLDVATKGALSFNKRN